MLDVGFSEVLVIFVLALVVLGPEKLPRVASQVGRLVGRARAMARQFKEQLEEEVNLEQVRKAQAANPPKPPVVAEPEAQSQLTAESAPVAPSTADPVDFTADTFSHAHATDEYGANPAHPSGAAATEPLAPELMPTVTPDAGVTAASTPAEGTPATGTDNTPRPEGTGAYASAAAPTAAPMPTPPASATTSSHERGT